MRTSWIELSLWLYVLNLGIACGAGLYESRIVVPQWLVGSEAAGYHWNRAAAAEANVGLRFWVYASTGPLTLLTLASVVALWYVPPPLRDWWMLAVGVGLLERGLTFGYFIPTMVRLITDTTMTDAEAVAKALTWVQLGYVRHAANIVGLLAAMKTFALFYARAAGQG
jgi:hypothetical protein